MDLITDLPKKQNQFLNILSVVYRFSKMAHFVPLQSDTTAEAVANAFTSVVVRQHGLPQTIVTDRDPRFLSKFW